ncbi:MAG: ROK family protein [Gaiellales bacterium]
MAHRGGIDLGGTKIQAVVVDDAQAVLGQARHPTPSGGGPEGVITAMAGVMREAAAAAGLETGQLAGVGAGSPGTVDPAAGTIANARNVAPGWEAPVPAAAMLSEMLESPVRVGHDVTVGTEAEFRLGAGREFDSILGVFWGTGVGSGIILKGRPWSGRGAAGELGHMVVRRGGARCTCGRIGCIEAYAGRSAMEIRARALEKRGAHTDLFRIMEKKHRTRLTSGVWADALETGDRLAVKLIDRAVASLAAGIASAVNLLDVQAVIIGGGLGTRLGEPYVQRIAEQMLPHLFVDQHPPAVRVAALGDLGGAIGAALLVPQAAGTDVPAPTGSDDRSTSAALPAARIETSDA